MAFKFPDKDPDEQLDYTVDWSRYLTDAQSIDLENSSWKIQKKDGTYVSFFSDQSFEGDAVIAKDASVLNGLTMESQTFTTNKAIIVLSRGIANTAYRLLCEIKIDGTNVTTNREINLRVRERS